MEAIIVSGMPAVGKTTVVRIIAKELKLQTIGGGDILKEMAMEHGVKTTGDDWWDTKEGIKFLREREKSSKFDEEVDRRLLKKVEQGNVIITSYTLPWLSKKGIKIWLAGSVASRAKRMARRDKLSAAECRRIISVRDKENYKIYMRLYKIEFGKDLSPFDIIIGTDSMNAEQVGRIALRLLRKRKTRIK